MDPHGPVEPRQAIEPPALDSLIRGIALVAAALLVLFGAGRAARAGRAGIAAVPVLGTVAALLAWGGAVQLGGGARYDDHPWV